MKKWLLGFAALAVFTPTMMLTGCDEIEGVATIRIVNGSPDRNIVELKVKGPGQADFGGNVLQADIAPNGALQYEVEAPTRSEDEQGVRYEFQLTYEGILDLGTETDFAAYTRVHAGDQTTWAWSPGNDQNVELE